MDSTFKDPMDIPIRKKHWAIRYKYYLIGGVVFVSLLIYLLIISVGPRRLRYDLDRLEIAQVEKDKFMEYLDVEGAVQPKLTIRLNTDEAGTVDEIIAEDGSLLKEGDIILTLKNPDLDRSIEDERDELSKIRLNHQEKQIQMERKSSELKRNSMGMAYKQEKLTKEFNLNEEEFKLGIISKAQYEIAVGNYEYSLKEDELLRQEMQHDSLMNRIQLDLLSTDLSRAEKRFERSRERLDRLIVRAPGDGQLSFINVIPGERVNSGSNIGELKLIDQVKISTKVSEYYIDRITPGLPATITYQDTKYTLKITRVNPEIRDRQFEVDLVFTDEHIENIRIGKSYRVQIELEQPEEALVIKKGNFFQSTGGQWIFKLDASGNKATRVPISIGRQNPRQYEILEGLNPGDKIIITGYDNFGEVQEIVFK